MVFAHRIFAQILGSNVMNVTICNDYSEANWLAQQAYGNEAFAVECTQYPCKLGDLWHDNTFFRKNPDGTEERIEYIPTNDEKIETIKFELDTIFSQSNRLHTSITDLFNSIQ